MLYFEQDKLCIMRNKAGVGKVYLAEMGKIMHREIIERLNPLPKFNLNWYVERINI